MEKARLLAVDDDPALMLLGLILPGLPGCDIDTDTDPAGRQGTA